jgi:hypothetical protein
LTELASIQSLSEVGISPTDNVCIVAWHSTIVVMLWPRRWRRREEGTISHY